LLIGNYLLLIESPCSKPVYSRPFYSIGVIPIHQPLELLINGVIGGIGGIGGIGDYWRGAILGIAHKIARKIFFKKLSLILDILPIY
jgi:hypothetical protein